MFVITVVVVTRKILFIVTIYCYILLVYCDCNQHTILTLNAAVVFLGPVNIVGNFEGAGGKEKNFTNWSIYTP